MPIRTVVNKKWIVQQWLIILSLSMSGIFLATEFVFSSNENRSNSASQDVSASSRSVRSERAPQSSNPLSGTPTPLEDEDPTPPPAPSDPGGAVPIDGGLGILLAAGVGYGVKRIYKNRKGQN
jgi:hypothetical protein